MTVPFRLSNSVELMQSANVHVDTITVRISFKKDFVSMYASLDTGINETFCELTHVEIWTYTHKFIP